MTDAWLNELANTLGVDELSQEEISRLLAVARDVAHGVERRITPLSAFLLGAAVERRNASGVSRAAALDDAIASLHQLIPDAETGAVP